MLPGVRLDGPSALVCVLGFLYLSTAAMAASGRSFLRAAGLGLAWALVLAAAPAYAFWGFLKVTDSYVPVQWTMMAIADACGGESGVWVAGTLAWLGYLAVPAIGTLVPTARATRTLPLAPSMRQIATPGLVAFLAWTAVLSVVQLTLYVTAPDEVRYGDRVLVVETDFPEQSSPMPYLRLFPVGIDRDRSYTDRKRSNRYDSGHLATTWSGLHSGSYEVCLAFEVRQPTPQGTQEPGQHYEVCEPVEVTDAESPQVVDLDLDPSRAVPAHH
jgi:hypothetical protein